MAAASATDVCPRRSGGIAMRIRAPRSLAALTLSVTMADPAFAQGGPAGQQASLHVTWADGGEWSQPYTFFEEQLVFPNVPNRRQFWERIN
jgi:hypothetical protein